MYGIFESRDVISRHCAACFAVANPKKPRRGRAPLPQRARWIFVFLLFSAAFSIAFEYDLLAHHSGGFIKISLALALFLAVFLSVPAVVGSVALLIFRRDDNGLTIFSLLSIAASALFCTFNASAPPSEEWFAFLLGAVGGGVGAVWLIVDRIRKDDRKALQEEQIRRRDGA